jgi:hypothetical protein
MRIELMRKHALLPLFFLSTAAAFACDRCGGRGVYEKQDGQVYGVYATEDYAWLMVRKLNAQDPSLQAPEQGAVFSTHGWKVVPCANGWAVARNLKSARYYCDCAAGQAIQRRQAEAEEEQRRAEAAKRAEAERLRRERMAARFLLYLKDGKVIRANTLAEGKTGYFGKAEAGNEFSCKKEDVDREEVLKPGTEKARKRVVLKDGRTIEATSSGSFFTNPQPDDPYSITDVNGKQLQITFGDVERVIDIPEEKKDAKE